MNYYPEKKRKSDTFFSLFASSRKMEVPREETTVGTMLVAHRVVETSIILPSGKDGIGYYQCICLDGNFGQNCELELNQCRIVAPCMNGGKCITMSSTPYYRCDCGFFYLGDQCETARDMCFSNPCMNNAVCISTHLGYDCICEAGWTGAYCDTNVNECELDMIVFYIKFK